MLVFTMHKQNFLALDRQKLARNTGRFVLDTGAVLTTITHEFADSVGYSARDGFKRAHRVGLPRGEPILGRPGGDRRPVSGPSHDSKAELDADNVVVETSRGWPSSVMFGCRVPFRVQLRRRPKHVLFREINDPHYWLAEYECTKHQHLLACKHR